MSTYLKETLNPATGEWETATWHDDHFGNHYYGVEFPSQPGAIYDPRHTELETRPFESNELITRDHKPDELEDKVYPILLSRELLKRLNHKLNLKQNEVWVELRTEIRKQSPICLDCGKEK